MFNKNAKTKEAEKEPAPVVPTVEEVIAENKEEALDLSYTNGSTSFMSQSNEASTSSSEPNSALGDMFSETSSSSVAPKDDSQFVDINVPSESSESSENSFINFNTNTINDDGQSSTSNNENKKDGESELSKFFQ